MTLRTALVADIDAIATIEAACFPAAWSRNSLESEVAAPGRCVLVDAEHQGYACAMWVGQSADLLRIAVLPEARRRGLARQLLAGVVAHVRWHGAEEMLLEVASDNRGALGLYESEGFVPIHRRRGYYPGGVDAVVMRQVWR